MCVICLKPVGMEFPTVETIKNCCERNSDGFAMAWNEDGKVKNYKSMSMNTYLKYYEKLIARLDYKTTGMVLHMRIATHGSKGVKNCHCWLGSGFAFAHNGILHNITPTKDRTDSETFFREIFQPVYEHCGWGVATKVIKGIIGTSRFAFIDKYGRISQFGQYEKYEGCFFSNDSYRKRVAFYGGRYLPSHSAADDYDWGSFYKNYSHLF